MANVADDERNTIDLARFIAFSDNIFGFAITLLVVGIAVPTIADVDQLPYSVAALLPSFLTFALSFAVIARLWLGHNRFFRHIVSVDVVLTVINLLLLFSVAFLPFPSALVARYASSRFAVVFYAVSLLVVQLLFGCLWTYATLNRRLMTPDISPMTVRVSLLRPWLSVAIFALSIGLAFWNVEAAVVAWLATLVIPPLSERFIRRAV